jgi:hypothetical protein
MSRQQYPAHQAEYVKNSNRRNTNQYPHYDEKEVETLGVVANRKEHYFLPQNE